jgi:hypothetical protein
VAGQKATAEATLTKRGCDRKQHLRRQTAQEPRRNPFGGYAAAGAWSTIEKGTELQERNEEVGDTEIEVPDS